MAEWIKRRTSDSKYSNDIELSIPSACHNYKKFSSDILSIEFFVLVMGL